MEFIQIPVKLRDERGSKAARRLRRSGSIPAVLYGLGRRNLPITIAELEVERFMKTGSHLLELKLDEQTRPAILREVQWDNLTDSILHIDFHRVDRDADLEDDVLLVFKGEAAGIKEGGVFTALEETLRVSCRPNLIPREIVIDISGLAIGDAVYARDIELAEGVATVTLEDTILAHVALPKVVAETTEEDEEGETPEGEAPTAAPEGGAPAGD